MGSIEREVIILLVEVKSRLNESEIRELLEYSVFPDPGNLEKVISDYETNDGLYLYGYESEGEIVGIIGFEMTEKREAVIRHISVKPEFRGFGYGRGQILEVID